MLGVLLIRKPAGLTSHDVVNDVRRRFGTRRVGHAGTLDPIATGLLVVAVGPATRFLQYLHLEPKEYVGTFLFGESTNSYDSEGDVIECRPVPTDLDRVVYAALPRFRGLIRQIPPMFSAVKVQGKPLYSYARKGTEVVREERTVHIGRFDAMEFNAETARFHIECSGGTYVRTLAHDLGEAVGCGAHLIQLERTRVGRFRVEQGHDLDDLVPEHVIPLVEALLPMPMVALTPGEVVDVRHGRALLRSEVPESNFVGLLEPSGNVFSVARVIGRTLQPECVIPAEAQNERPL